MGCENNCINEHRFTALQKELDTLKEKNSNDHEKFFNRIEENREKMVESQSDRQNIREKLDEIGVDVKTIMQTPAKRYDMIITSVLTGVIGALIGFCCERHIADVKYSTKGRLVGWILAKEIITQIL